MKGRWILAALVLLLVAAMATKGALVRVPPVEAASASGFDTARALARLERILGDERPHPVDSAANDAVRARLIAELRAIGLSPRVTDDFACNGREDSRAVSCARVRNVLATMGPTEGRHLVLASHYDSSPAGPGAADDGIGMAVMLETAAQLKGKRLARPVTLLFTDGEEAGLLGAAAFLDNNPLADRVGTLLNFEARGVTGPAVMFETNIPNGEAIALYKSSVARPAANSLTADFAKLVPNSTDVELFKTRRDWTILNFAVIGNETRYHSPGDTLAALDRRSVRHMGDQALALAAAIAAGSQMSAVGEHAYADLLGRFIVVMPLWASLVALALLAASFGFLAWKGRRGAGRAALAVAAAMAGAAALSFVLQFAVGLARAGEYWRAYPEAKGLAVYLTTLLACAAALLWVGRGVGRGSLRAGYWLVFLILGAVLALVAPGASIFFLLPPLVAGAGILARGRIKRAEQVACLLAWAALFLTWAPLLDLTEALLDMDSAWMFAPVAALLMLPVLIELKPLLAAQPRKGALAAFALLALAGWIGAALAPAYSEDRKQAFGIEYVRDEEGPRWMVVNDGAPLPAAFAAFEGGLEVPWSSRDRWAAPAPKLKLQPPALEKIGEQETPGGRLVRLRLRTGGAETVMLRAEPEADLRALGAGGSVHRFGAGDAEDDYLFRCHGRSCDGLTVSLHTGSRKPVEATLIGISSGLPPQARPLVAARPADAAPQYGADSTVTASKLRL